MTAKTAKDLVNALSKCLRFFGLPEMELELGIPSIAHVMRKLANVEGRREGQRVAKGVGWQLTFKNLRALVC